MQDPEQARQTVAGAADQMMPFTITHLIGIAIFAAVAIAAILWGMRLRARRRAADRELAEIDESRQDETGAPIADPDAPGEAIATERRTPVEPTDLPAPAPQPVQEPQQTSTPRAPEAQPAQEPQPAAPAAPSPIELPAEAPKPAPAASPSPAPAPVASPAALSTNDLTTLKGLGPKVAARLEELGFHRVADIAALTPAEAERLDASLGTFQGRMARDRWIEQAQLLTAGDRAGYEAKFGKLG